MVAQASDRIAEEQAALRRVATLVAAAAAPEEVFAAVAEEVGRLLQVDYAILSRFEPDGVATVVGAWTRAGGTGPTPLHTRIPLGGGIHTLMFESGGPARVDDYAASSGACAAVDRRFGIRCMVGVPIRAEGKLWGALVVASARQRPPPGDTEARLAAFAELVATAIANAQARVELRGFAEEQAALRRVATLVAQGVMPEKVFAAVAGEVRRVLAVDVTVMCRYDTDGVLTYVGWSQSGNPGPLGVQVPLGGRNIAQLVFQTGRPARIDDYVDASGAAADVVRPFGLRSAVGVPVKVEGQLWGVMTVASTGEPGPREGTEDRLPADTEGRLVGFTELVATAVANTEARAAVAASRVRIVAAADSARRRIERDLHDGAQQRLVSVALQLRGPVRAALPPEAEELRAQLDEVASEVISALDDLRELARGIHPSGLATGGLRPALRTLARRSAVYVELDLGVECRLPEQVEIAAYYVVSEALTNAAKHARASTMHVAVHTDWADGGAILCVEVRDDGGGGADLSRGSGLVGLKDRVEALGGRIKIESPVGHGTSVHVALPIPGESWGNGTTTCGASHLA
ncbi:MAG TPA: GAF domain-containing sensor histidine kinase [Pseudonocardia sp.]